MQVQANGSSKTCHQNSKRFWGGDKQNNLNRGKPGVNKSLSPVVSCYLNMYIWYRNVDNWLKDTAIRLRWLVLYASVVIGLLAAGPGVHNMSLVL